MTQISKRLSVEGPDRDGDFEVTIGEDKHMPEWHFITRDEANILIVALGGTPPVAITEAEWRDLGRPAGEDE